MNKGRTAVEKIALSKPTWEIMKIISEIIDFISPIIFGAIFRVLTSRMLWKTFRGFDAVRRRLPYEKNHRYISYR